MTKKFRLLLLDANIIIELHCMGIWERVLEHCDIFLAETVVSESEFYEDCEGNKILIDFSRDIKEKRISIVSVLAEDVIKFRAQYDINYRERLGPGEEESLTYLFMQSEPYTICSADSIVYKILGNHNRHDNAVSLEEILNGIGLGRKLHPMFSKYMKEQWLAKGAADGIQGFGKIS